MRGDCMTRTIEQTIKFDCGLKVGITPVTVQRRDGSRYDALVEITLRGVVRLMPKPGPEDMYTDWYRFKGNTWKLDSSVVVWGARNPEWLRQFDSPVALVVIPQEEVK